MSSNFLHYEVIEKLGEGGMGIVYLARDSRLNRKVALKFLPEHISKDQEKRQRFRVEAQAAAKLSHPNIAQVHAIEESEGDLCIVLEYVEGEELKTLIEEKQLTSIEKSEIAHEIADGINAAHDKGIIHRDIKSRNIMMDGSGSVKIMDFGLARKDGSDHITNRGTTVGTTAYMSPEQLRGEEADFRADIWAFGVVLYELFTGKMPFRGMHEAAIMYSITEEDPIPIKSEKSVVPEQIKKVIDRCLEKDPDDRYQKMEEVLRDLDKEIDNSDQSTMPLFSIPSQSTYLTIGIAAVTLLISIFFFYQQHFFNLFNNIPEKKYLAVLPIENFGNTPGMEEICDGLAETLSYRLSELEQYEDSYWVTPASEIRKENVASASRANEVFGVNLAISSSVQTFQDSTRLQIELIDADNVITLGAEQVVVHSDNLARLEQEGVRAMLNMLHIEVQPIMAEKINQSAPDDPEAYEHYLKGRASLQKDANIDILDTAINHFENALDIDPNFALAHSGLGESYWRKYVINRDVSLVDQAKTSLNKAQSINEKLPPVQYLMGLIENGTGNYTNAISHFENALDLDPKYTAAIRGMARTYSNMGDSAKVVSIYNRIIDQKPDYWAGYKDLGDYYLTQGNWEQAIKYLKKVVELTPKNSKAYSNLGIAYFRVNKLDSSRLMFEQSMAIDENPITANNLAAIYYRNGNYSEAADMYKIVLENKEYRSRYEFWGSYAGAVEWSEKKDGEEKLYRTAIEKAEAQLEVNPKDPIVLSYIAVFHSDLDNRENALEYINRALNLNQENNKVLVNAISTYENLGMRDEALRWVRADIIPQLQWLPDLKSLTNDTEYTELKEKLLKQNQ